MSDLVTLDDVRAAAAVIRGHVLRTPFLKSQTLSTIVGAEVWLKFENLQFTASFKERGAANILASLTEAERARGVIAMSAGNHAQGVAHHARRLGVAATIVMPRFTPFTKIAQTEAHGAEVVLAGESLHEAADRAHALAAERGLVFVHPYDDSRIVAGQGTIGLEMLADAPQLDALVIPVGGGGLASGIAVAAKALKPAIRILAVEVAGYDSLRAKLAGEPEPVGQATVAEGIAVKKIGALPAALLAPRLEGVVVVPEEAVERAIALLAEIEKTVVEGAGAAGLAALLTEPERLRGAKVGLVLCGGNIDPRLLAAVILRQLVRDGRLLRLSLDIADQPGALARVSGAIAEAGGNILEVEHQRLFGAATAKSAALTLLVEARDRAHGQAIAAAVARLGVARAG